MTIYPVTAPEFAPYGRVITGYETECEAVVAALSASTPLPEGTDYLAEDPALKKLDLCDPYADRQMVFIQSYRLLA